MSSGDGHDHRSFRSANVRAPRKEAGMPYPILIDQYITGKELEIDLISDGHEVFVPTYTEHIERA